MNAKDVVDNFNAGQNIFRRKSVGVVVDELLHWQQSYRALDTVAREQRTRLEEMGRWSALWKRSAKKLWGEYNSLADARLKCWNELNEERAIVYRLEQENARLRAELEAGGVECPLCDEDVDGSG